MDKNTFPILEFDGQSPNYISAQNNIEPGKTLPQRCVISFFGDAVQDLAHQLDLPVIGQLKLESIYLPIYQWVSDQGESVAIMHGLGSGPYAAGQIEKLVAMGCKKFMVCGGCGVLYKGSLANEIYIPTTALRDEGTSYHYVAPSRQIEMDACVRDKMVAYLSSKQIPYRCVKTWTTDAMYRETVDLIKARRDEGCDVVEMECASFLAVAQYKKIQLGQILYGGDDLSGKSWNSRNWKSQLEFRKYFLQLAIDLCCAL